MMASNKYAFADKQPVSKRPADMPRLPASSTGVLWDAGDGDKRLLLPMPITKATRSAKPIIDTVCVGIIRKLSDYCFLAIPSRFGGAETRHSTEFEALARLGYELCDVIDKKILRYSLNEDVSEHNAAEIYIANGYVAVHRSNAPDQSVRTCSKYLEELTRRGS